MWNDIMPSASSEESWGSKSKFCHEINGFKVRFKKKFDI